MAVIASPLSNSIQGINQSTVSGSVFGANRLDSETKSTLQSLSSSVTSLQNQVNELGKNNISNIRIFTNLQESFSTQIGGLSLQLNKVNETLESIATITANESAIERQKDLYEQEKEKRLATIGAKEGQESLLETKIQSALSEPVNRIGNKISFGFNNLMSAMWTLLGGWLTLEGIKVLKALQDGDKKQLNEIKDSVIKTLGIASGIFLIINVGIGKVIGSIVGLAGKIGKFVIKNTIGKLFEGIASLAKGATKAITGGAKEAEAATKGVTSGVEKGAGEGLLSGIGKIGKGIAKTGFNLALGGFDFIGRKKEGQTDIQAGAGAAGSLATAELGAKIGSKFPGPLKLPATLIGSVGGYVFGGKGADILTGVDKSKSPKPKPKPATAKPAPKTTMTPPASNLQINAPDTQKATNIQNASDSQKVPDTSKPATSAPSPEMISQFEQAWKYKDNPLARGRIEGAWNKMSPEQKQQAKDWAESTGKNWKEMKLPDTNQTSSVSAKEAPRPAETSSKPSTLPATTTTAAETSSKPSTLPATTTTAAETSSKPSTLPATTTTTAAETSSKPSTLPTTTTTAAETSSKPSTPEITPAQTTKMQTVPFNIGPEPEPKPNIVYASSGSSAPSQQQQPLSTGAASDVPFIPSSNPDNFYTLYSQINYNVVP